MVSDELVSYARAIAPHVDRLAIAVHKHARPAGQALLREFGLDRAGVLIDARPLLLAGPTSLDDVAVIDRYVPREDLAAGLEEQVRSGMLARDESTETPLYDSTTRGRDLLLRLSALQGATVAALWAVHETLLPELASAATWITDRAAATLPLASYPAFRRLHAAPAPLGASPAHLLLIRLTALRYLRADAHALALATQQIDAPQADAITALWKANNGDGSGSVEAPGDVLDALQARGLVERDEGQWRFSDPGRMLREAIEEETNRAAAPPFAVLDAADREAFLQGLETLPD